MDVYKKFRNELDSIFEEIQKSFLVFFQGKPVSLTAYRKQIDELMNRINGLFKLERDIFNELDETNIESKVKFQTLNSRYSVKVNESIENIFKFVNDSEFHKLRNDKNLRLLKKGKADNSINKAFEEKKIQYCSIHCAESLVYVLYKFEDFFKQINIELNYNTQFISIYEQEVTPERIAELENNLAAIKTNEEKVSFLIKEKAKYLQNIPPQTLEVSGSVHSNFAPNAEFFFDRYIQIEIDKIRSLMSTLPPQQIETKTEQEQQGENDFTLSTIEDWLFEFNEKMNEADYKTLVSALKNYFDTGIFPILSKPIQVNGRPNKKLFGWALNRIFEAKGKGVEKELLLFAKQNISLFADVEFDENNILKSNLYKYFTTQTK